MTRTRPCNPFLSKRIQDPWREKYRSVHEQKHITRRRRRYTRTRVTKTRWPVIQKCYMLGRKREQSVRRASMQKKAPTLSSATGRHRIGRSAAPVQDSSTLNSDSRIKEKFSHLDFSPVVIAPAQQQILRRGTEELRVWVEIVVIRLVRHRCLRFNGLRRAIRAAGHTGGGVLDVDVVDGVPTAHGDDEPGGIVFRVENVAAA